MQRNPNESFADYKERRAAANLAVRRINAESKGGTINTRANRPGKGKGIYAKNLMAHFAKNALAEIQRKHRLSAAS